MVRMSRAIKRSPVPKNSGGLKARRVTTSHRVVPKARHVGSGKRNQGVPSAKRMRGKPTRNITSSMKKVGRKKFT